MATVILNKRDLKGRIFRSFEMDGRTKINLNSSKLLRSVNGRDIQFSDDALELLSNCNIRMHIEDVHKFPTEMFVNSLELVKDSPEFTTLHEFPSGWYASNYIKTNGLLDVWDRKNSPAFIGYNVHEIKDEQELGFVELKVIDFDGSCKIPSYFLKSRNRCELLLKFTRLDSLGKYLDSHLDFFPSLFCSFKNTDWNATSRGVLNRLGELEYMHTLALDGFKINEVECDGAINLILRNCPNLTLVRGCFEKVTLSESTVQDILDGKCVFGNNNDVFWRKFDAGWSLTAVEEPSGAKHCLDMDEGAKFREVCGHPFDLQRGY